MNTTESIKPLLIMIESILTYLTSISTSLPFRLVSRYFLLEDLSGSPRFRRAPFGTVPLPKTPEEHDDSRL
jgi:hypothetical protein